MRTTDHSRTPALRPVAIVAALLATLLAVPTTAPAHAESDWRSGWCEQGEGLSVVVDFGAASGPGIPAEGWTVRCLVGGTVTDSEMPGRVTVLLAVGLDVAHESNGYVTGIAGVTHDDATSSYWMFSASDDQGAWDPGLWDLAPGTHVDRAFGAHYSERGGSAVPRPQPQYAVPAPRPDPAVSGSVPTVRGKPRVGHVLTADVGEWSAGARLAFQWFRGNTRIAGATRGAYTLTPADLGRRVSVRVTGTLATHSPTTRSSVRTAKVSRGRLTAAKPRLTGRPKVGKTLRAVPGTWRPKGVRTRFRWLRDGKVVKGATGRTYRLRPRDRGSRVSVRVIGTKKGYVTLRRTIHARRAVR